jgi:ADP-heptose:LPS heptosyltransferase
MEDPRKPTALVPIVSTVEVAALTIDDFCAAQRIEHIDYLKLDVEGAEFRALCGAKNTLSSRKVDHLQFEVSRKMLEGLNATAKPVFDLLAQYGYLSRSITKEGTPGPRVSDSGAFYENYIATPDAATTRGSAGDPLPVHFFTLVLNGRPFIQQHIETFRRLPFAWHWHIVEGVAQQNHDSSWMKQFGGRVTESIHRNGLSHDGTTEYLDELARQFPESITIYRKGDGRFWDGKVEMANAPLPHIKTDCLLWEIDVDELWTADQIRRARELFLANPAATAAFYHCHFFVGGNLVISTRDTYGNHPAYEWLRTWRYTPGCHWASHSPPRLCQRNDDRKLVDLATVRPLRHALTEAAGLVFQHYAYVTEEQLRFKEVYYGYRDACKQWERLQRNSKFPAKLVDFCAWVKDGAMVDTAAALGVTPLLVKDAKGDWRRTDAGSGARESSAPANAVSSGAPRKILFVRTDSIGDNVLAASMLGPIRARFPNAEIAVLCQEHIAELYVSCPHVNAIVCFDFNKLRSEKQYFQSIVSEIRAFGPDLILNSIYSREAWVEALLLNFKGIQSIGMEGNLSNISASDRTKSNAIYSHLVQSPETGKTELDHHRDFLAALGISEERLQPVVWTTLEEEMVADAFFKQHGLDPAKTVAVFPGAQQPIRFYPHYAEALESMSGYQFLIFGGPDSVPLCDELAARFPGRATTLAGRTPFARWRH